MRYVFSRAELISFNTAVESTEKELHLTPGSLIVDRKVIAKKYLRGWFAIDFGSTVPWRLGAKKAQIAL